MKNGNARPKKTSAADAFVKLPRSVLDSEAWRNLRLHARRFIDCLMIEHLRHGGKENGQLKATHRQLIARSISARLIAPAIREACRSGLVRITRPGGRHLPTLYELTWLPSHPAVHQQPQPEATAGEPAP
jgi:hypothetical protein